MDDLVSELPEVLIHRIMSFLPFNEAIRTSVLSSRFHSACRSFPILEFDIDCLDRSNKMSPEMFLQHVLDSLRNRSMSFLQKLRIRANLNYALGWRLRDVIILAASSNLGELELENCTGDEQDYALNLRNHYIVLPRNVFSLRSLNVLKVENFKFSTRHVVLGHFSTLKKLSISGCVGFNTIKIIKTTRLAVLEILNCKDLKLIEIDAPNLESVEFLSALDPLNTPRPCEIRFTPDCKSLRNLKLTHTTFTESLFRENISICQMVENLNVNASNTLKCMCIDSANLKKLELKDFEGLESIEILSQNLQSCVFDMSKSSPCAIRFSGTKFLRVLTLCSSEAITGSWIEQNMPQLCFLEYLTLDNCSKLEWTRLRHERVKNLNLINCNALMEVQIDAPKLDSLVMKLKDNIPTHLVILSGNLHVKLSLTVSFMEAGLYETLKNFLVSFDHCRELTLDFSSNYDLLFPLEVRDKMISPLYDVKQLKIELGSKWHRFSDLLSGLLWLVPLPESITFTSPQGDRSIQFQYADFKVKEDKETSCCLFYPVKCWRHVLRSVQLKNFKDIESKEIVNFLGENALRLESIRDYSETTSPFRDSHP